MKRSRKRNGIAKPITPSTDLSEEGRRGRMGSLEFREEEIFSIAVITKLYLHSEDLDDPVFPGMQVK